MIMSVMLVVATEQLWGKRGMPTTQFSLSSTSRRRKLPALCGMSGSRQAKTAWAAAMVEVTRVRFMPASTQSGLSRRSTVMKPASPSMSMVTLIGMPSGRNGWIGSWQPSFSSRPLGSARIDSLARRSE